MSVAVTSQKISMDMITYFDVFVTKLDKIISTANSKYNKEKGTKELAMKKSTRLYEAYLSTQQQKTRYLDYLLTQGSHDLSDDEHAITLKLTDNIQSSWYCNICEKEYGTPRKDIVLSISCLVPIG